MMKSIFAAVAALAALALVPGQLLASHPGDQLELRMAEKEPFFESIGYAEAPGFDLQDADGRPVGLSDFRDKVVILHFDDATCADACPDIAGKIAAVQSSLNASPMKDMVQFLTVSTDPAADDPEALRGYAASHGFDPANWAFLTTRPGQSEEATQELAARYEAHQAEAAPAQEVATHVIDRDGRYAARFNGLEFENVNLVLYVNGLINNAQHGGKKPAGLWDRIIGALD